MDRRRFLLTSLAGALRVPLAAEAQQPGKVPRIGVVAGESGNTASAIGGEAIKRVLTGQKQWTLYWDRSGVERPRFGKRPSDRSLSATIEFMRLGGGLVAHQEGDELLHRECEFEVTVNEDGFIFPGCWGSDVTMTYDPDDREYPFKARTIGTLLWLAPSK